MAEGPTLNPCSSPDEAGLQTGAAGPRNSVTDHTSEMDQLKSEARKSVEDAGFDPDLVNPDTVLIQPQAARHGTQRCPYLAFTYQGPDGCWRRATIYGL